MLTLYNPYFSWASLNPKRELTSMTTDKKIKAFRCNQTLCKHDEKSAIVGTYKLDLLCQDESIASPYKFTFIYATFFDKGRSSFTP